MKIQSQQLKKLNITALFDKLDQSQVTSETIRDLFDLKGQEKENTPFVELPGTKVLIMPALKKEVVVEPNRLRVSDSNVEDLNKSKIVSDFEKIYEAFSGKSILRAYGFNYDIALQLRENISYDKLLSSSLKNIINGGELLEAGARVVFTKKGRKFDIQIVPSGQEKQIEVHANIHYESEKIDFTKLTKELVSNYKEIEGSIKNFMKG
ncbi:MAG: hypothetical protein ABIB61_04900 [Candidatus Shapirobacteria bacterium]